MTVPRVPGSGAAAVPPGRPDPDYPEPWPGRPGQPGRPGWPRPPGRPGQPDWPGQPGWPERSPGPGRTNPALQPVQVWFDPGRPVDLSDRLLGQRIVLAHGYLDGEAATRLCAQLLTLDAEGTGPIRLELHNLEADLVAAGSVMGVLDVVRGQVSGYVGGRIQGPALGVLAACHRRWAYPNALLVLSEPRVSFDGTVTTVAAREQQAQAMLGELFARVAAVTGRDVAEVRADARRERLFSVAEAARYGLVEGEAPPRGLPGLPGLAGAPGEGEDGRGDGGSGPGDH